MKLLLVTFSLRNETRDYNPFFLALRGNVLQWWHFIEQTCVVATEHTAQSLTEALVPHIENTDSLLVVQITPHQMQSWLPVAAWEWLQGVSEAIAPTRPAHLCEQGRRVYYGAVFEAKTEILDKRLSTPPEDNPRPNLCWSADSLRTSREASGTING